MVFPEGLSRYHTGEGMGRRGLGWQRGLLIAADDGGLGGRSALGLGLEAGAGALGGLEQGGQSALGRSR